VAGFGNRSTLVRGEKYFVAETCEYRRHFLHFRPRRAVVTGVEADHLDYYRSLEDVLQAFASYVRLLPEGGTLILNQDDEGAREVARRLRKTRVDLRLVPYGTGAEGPFRITTIECAAGETRFRLDGFAEAFVLKLPGRHMAANAAAAIALAVSLLAAEGRETGAGEAASLREALAAFRGSRRRSEVVGEAGGVLFVDDYGHHPTEIRATLEGLRSFYPDRRLLLDFMPHTYSRTQALLKQFGGCFEQADEVILHRIYASARERAGTVDGRTLFREVARHHPSVRYFEDPLEAVGPLSGELRPGDLFVTMGAGDNWRVGRELLARRGGEP